MRINSGNIGAILVVAGLIAVWIMYWLVTQQSKQKSTPATIGGRGAVRGATVGPSL